MFGMEKSDLVENGAADEQTLEEIIDEFIDANPIVYERLSKL